MAEPRDISSILAALGAAQRGTSSTPTQAQPGMPPGYPPPPGAQPSYPPMPPQSASPYGAAGGYPMPQPSASGSLDLSSIRPVNSGTVSIADAIAQAKAFAAEKGVTSYDRPLVYSNEPRAQDSRGGYHRSSRSRSPPNRRDQFRDNFNPYRDERRDDRPPPRDYGRDRSYSPGPRGRAFSPRNSGARERSPLRGSGGGGDDNSETIQIESSLVGLIIGRQGENLRRIEAESSCRVQFLPSSDNGPYRQCKITGPRARRAEVKTSINRIIDDSGMGAINRGAANPKGAPRDNRGAPPGMPAGGGAAAAAGAGAAALRDGEDCMQIMVPDRTVGLIIGRGGETIRDLQERSGCHINIVGESKSVNGLRPVNLIGSRESAAQAKDLIMEIVDSDSRNEGQPAAPAKKPPRQDGGYQRDAGPGGGGTGDKIHDAIYVPSEAVGMIIGKGGETIRDMQNGTGCKINVAQSSGPGEVQREIALIGSRDSIARAKQAIEEKVDAVRQKNSGGGGGGGGGGRGRQNQDYDNRSYSQQGSNSAASGPTNPPAAAQAPAGANGEDPYAQYGGYQNYLALWYQSVLYQQQQGGAPGQPGAQPPSAS
ncbi:KH domain-containing protein [Colletotrichum karsti]|uniref:KH domain-containing protein n=1 Tax=Colletotrichum karsti TaxID=1095194 RepID=A0A9P6LMR5_9PEZI|nr:KH domain-containing protein [Colletotrichum karsti]KAF9878461.1 KH domain-containing protein [Colletotrichum karsti]